MNLYSCAHIVTGPFAISDAIPDYARKAGWRAISASTRRTRVLSGMQHQRNNELKQAKRGSTWSASKVESEYRINLMIQVVCHGSSNPVTC